MTDFSTEKQIRDKLKGYKPKLIGPIGEAAVALQFLDVFKDSKIIFDEIGFSWDNYKLNNNLKGELGFPSWFNKSLSCKYLANYAANRREFYKREITSKWKERIDLNQMIENAIINKPKKSRINEEYPIDSSFCKNCTQKCKYIPIMR